MLNRYSKLPKATIRNTQVLTDLGIIDTALQRKQAKYDAQASFQNQAIQGAETLPVFGEHDTAYKNKITEDLKNKALEISNMDLADPNVSSGMNQYIQTMGADPKLAKAVQAKSMYDEFQKSRTDLAAKGKLPTSAEQLKQLAWNEYSKTGELSEDAVNPLYENQNLIQGRGELVNNIKSSSHEGTALMSGRGYGVKSGGVSYEKIGKAVRDQLDAYANSPYGRQEHDDFRLGQRNGSIPQNMKFGDYLLKSVLSTANTYQHSNTSADYSGVINTLDDRAYAEKKEKEKEQKENYDGEGFSPAIKTNQVELDEDGNFDQNMFLDAWDSFTGDDSRAPEVKEAQKSFENSYKKSGFKGTKQEYAAELNKSPNIHVAYYSTKKSDEESKKFWNPKTGGGTFKNTMVWDEEGKYPNGISFVDWAAENKVDLSNGKAGITVVGDMGADNPMTPKGKQLVVNGKALYMDDKHSRPSVEDEYIHKVNQAKYNGTGKTTFEFFNPADKKNYRITSYSDGQQITKLDKEEIK